MAGIKEKEVWDNEVYQLEAKDPVEGGESGVDNRPHKSLANRTLWLKGALQTLKKLLTNHNHDKNYLFKNAKATNSEKLDGHEAKEFLGVNQTAIEAKKLSIARKISFSGKVKGSGTFDGSKDMNINFSCTDCTGGCSGGCVGSCSGCTGSCTGSCSGCSGSCTSGCSGCSSCSGGCSGRSCFTKGQKVLMADKSYKKIEDVKIGDKLLGAYGFINRVIYYDRPLREDRVIWDVDGLFTTSEHGMLNGKRDGFLYLNLDKAKSEYGKYHKCFDKNLKAVNVWFEGLKKTKQEHIKIGDFLASCNGKREIKRVKKTDKKDKQLFHLIVDGDMTYCISNTFVSSFANDEKFNYSKGTSCKKI